MKRILMFLACGVWLAASMSADDWPEFRGPTGQGHVLNGPLPVEWGPGKNVAWSQTVPGLGWSSPIIANGRVYVTTAVPITGSAKQDQSLQAICLDAATGKQLWQREVFRQDGANAPRIHGKNSHASSTPITDGERLYVHFGHQGTACLDLEGKVLWRNTTLKYQPVHGNGGSPILVDDRLVFSIDGSDKQLLVALDKKTGKVLWRTNRKTNAVKKFSFSTPLLIDVNGTKQIVSQASECVCAYEPRTGREIWRVQYDGYSVVPRPVFGHGLVYVCTGYERPTLIAIRPDGKGDVTKTHVAWTVRRNAPLNPSPLLVGDDLYMISDNGIASCLDAKTGEARWQERVGGNHSSSPIHADGKVYFLDEEGTATVIKTGPVFERVSRNSLEEQTLASFAAADGALFIRTESRLYKIGP